MEKEIEQPINKIKVGEVYFDKSTDRTFIAMYKDVYSVYDSNGWCYTPDNLKLISK